MRTIIQSRDLEANDGHLGRTFKRSSAANSSPRNFMRALLFEERFDSQA
jgi:hypothetical protein